MTYTSTSGGSATTDLVIEVEKRILERFPEAEFRIRQGLRPDDINLYVNTNEVDEFAILDTVGELTTDILIYRGVNIHLVPVYRLDRATRWAFGME
ncbi:MAG: hypothetical protein EPO21_08635 [Chloroflexota bacterium]|nr:MAG: hypothetical protein EPO21_08635 [Chloroflexota bacterium]